MRPDRLNPASLALAYVEPSAVDGFVRAEVGGAEARRQLAAHGYIPAIGLHVLHELARTLVYEKGDGTPLFQFVIAMSPVLLAEPWDLLRQELDSLLHGGTVAPLLEQEKSANVGRTLDELARGEVNDLLREEILARDEAKATEWPQSTEEYLARVKEMRRDDPTTFPRISTHSAILEHFRPSFANFLAGRSELPVPEEQAELMASRLDEFPAYRTDLYLWMYLILICIRDKVVPSHDRLDDFRHLVEGSYCQAFVTNDQALSFAAGTIAPHLSPVPLRSLVPKESGTRLSS